jgi:putative toxin-antitoxin system antitoxin component (TIGR02293 family)
MFAEIMRENSYNTYRIRLELLLGIPLSASGEDIHKLIEAGFSPSRIEALCQLRVLNRIERNQIISLKTLNSRLAREQQLTVHESDRLFRVIHITAMAFKLFGDSEKAKCWLSNPKKRFSGMSPMKMLTTTQGTRLVEEMLIQGAETFAF